MDSLLEMELELEVKALRDYIKKIESENKRLKNIIHDNNLSEELGVEKPLSSEEQICILGIDQILEAVKNKVADKFDIQNFDILHKNLRMIRGQSSENKVKQKKSDIKDLLKIVEGSK